MFSRIGPWEIILILVIVLIIFGAGKLPQVGSALGKGIRSFKQGANGDDAPDEEEEEEEPKKAPKRATAARTTTRKRTTARKTVKKA
jgi:sec-independent protein translocase protein TatA